MELLEPGFTSYDYDTPFALELKREVRGYFERGGRPLLKASKATPRRWLEIGLLFCLRAVTTLAWLSGESYWAVVLQPLCAWLCGVNVFHDACHFALSRTPWVNRVFSFASPEFSSPLPWYYQHNVMHHAYPNVHGKDPDLHHNDALCRKHPATKCRPAHAYQHITVVLEWLFIYYWLSLKSTLDYVWSRRFYNIRVVPSPAARELALHYVSVAVSLLHLVVPFARFEFGKAWREREREHREG